MRITRLNVQGFGRLRSRSFEFGDGLTIIHGANEAGKSTLHAALAASIFGQVPGGRRTPTLTAVIERHRPWHGDRYGTTLELEQRDGRSLRIDWDFDRRQFAVVDAVTGADLTSSHGAGTDTGNLAHTLHGVSREVYLRVGCVAQEEFAQIGSEAGDVRAAIERAADQMPSETGSEKAIEGLRSRRRRLVGLNRAPTNPLPRAEARAAELRAELDAATAARAEAEQLSADRDRAVAEARAIGRRIHALECALDAARWRSLQAVADNAEKAEERLTHASAAVAAFAQGAGFRPVEGIDGARERYAELRVEHDRLSERRIEAQADLDQLRVEPPEPELPPEHRSRAGWAITAAGAALTVAGFALSLVLVVLGILAMAAGIGLATLARRAEATRAALAREAHQERLAVLRGHATRLEVELAGMARVETDLAAARSRLAAMLGISEPDPEAIDRGLEAYDLSVKNHRGYVEAERQREVAEAELVRALGGSTIEQLRARCAELERALKGHRDAPGSERAPDEIETELTRLRGQGERTLVLSSSLSATAAERLRTVPDTGVLQEALDAVEEEVACLRRAEAVLLLAEQELEQTVAETYRDFAPRLNAALERNLGRATSGRYRRAFVADDLSVRLEAPETGAVIDVDLVSTGTQRLVYLVQRLELVQLVAPSAEPLPVLLDEPFAHLDADRMEAALDVLADVASDRQVVVFTSQSEAVTLAPFGSTVIELSDSRPFDQRIRTAGLAETA